MSPGRSRRKRGKFRRARACGNKRVYGQGEAVAAARALTKRCGVKYSAYQCRFCYLPGGARSWHVGHAVSLRRRLA